MANCSLVGIVLWLPRRLRRGLHGLRLFSRFVACGAVRHGSRRFQTGWSVLGLLTHRESASHRTRRSQYVPCFARVLPSRGWDARFLRGGNCQDNHVRKCSLSSPRRNGSRPRKLFHRESGAPKAPPRPPPHPRNRPGPCSHRPSQSDAGRDQTRGSSCASSCRR